MEFMVKGDLAKVKELELDANFAELNEWLEGELAVYRSLVVTPDNLAGAKTDRARIRKIAERIDEQRKLVKKAYMAPYNNFEAKCKQPVALCNEVVQHIDTQIKEHENLQKEAKKTELREHFDSVVAKTEIADYLEFDAIFDPRWLNATYHTETAIEEIDKHIKRVGDDLSVIRLQDEKYIPALLRFYSQSRNLAVALRELDRMKAVEQREAERLAAAAEASKKAAEAMKRTASAMQEVAEVAKTAARVNPVTLESAEPETMYSIGFRVHCTADQLGALKAFLKGNHIEYTTL